MAAFAPVIYKIYQHSFSCSYNPENISCIDPFQNSTGMWNSILVCIVFGYNEMKEKIDKYDAFTKTSP